MFIFLNNKIDFIYTRIYMFLLLLLLFDWFLSRQKTQNANGPTYNINPMYLREVYIQYNMLHTYMGSQ